ncbi:MAG: hypothetical protein H7X99_07320, partial [Saprospiraceae bacterium]|nr:hypothetical protein [Saprospiraceae bacterium]
MTIVLSIFLTNSLFSQSSRERDRQSYESKVISYLEKLDFNKIPWIEVFNDSKLRPSAVKIVFEEKLKSYGPENVNPRMIKKLQKYLIITNDLEDSKRNYIWQDEKLESLMTYANRSGSRTTNSANFTYIGQSNSVFNSNNGRIERVNFHPTNTNIVWASAPEGGLWKSNDAGVTWTVISDFWDHQSVGDLVYNTNNNDTLYVATDDHDSFFNQNRGVLRSVDGGTNWAIIGLPNSMASQIFKLAMAPDGRTLYACTNLGLFKSSNHGVTWVKNTSLPASAKANDIEFHPTNPQIVYVTTRSGTNQHPIGGPNTSYFYISTDGGSTFTLKICPLDSEGRPAQVSVSANNPDIAYISVYPNENYTSNGGMVMKYTYSTDFITTLVSPSYSFPGIWLGGAWDFRMEVNPNNANHIIYGSVQAFHSFNGGTTWQLLNSPHADQHDYKWQAGTNRVWFADDGGLSYTTDNGNTWTNIKNLPVTQLSSIRSSKYGSNFLVGLQDAGVQVNMNGHWFEPLGGDGLEVAVDPVDSNIVYGSIQQGQHLQRTIYNPTTQTYSSKTLLTNTQIGHYAVWRQKIIIDAADRNTIYTNYRDIWKSTNRGDTWINMTNGILGNGNSPIEFIHQAPSDPNILIAGYYDDNFSSFLKKSIDGGQTWASITKPSNVVFSSVVTNIAFHPHDPNTMWMIGNGLVSKTTNGGMTWTPVPGTLPNLDLLSIAYQEGTNNGFYVSTSLGNIWYHDDNINDYELFKNNLPNIRTTEIEVLPHNNKIRAATWGRGIWESPLHTNSINLCNKPAPPIIVYTVCATSSMMTIGVAPSGYNIIWEKDGVVISGQTTTSHTATTDGVYRARYLQNSGTCHSYYSDPANVTLRTQPTLLNGNGLHFDGVNDHLLSTNDINLSNSSLTISLWAKRQNVGNWQTLFSIGNTGQTNKLVSARFTNENKMVFGFEGNDLISTNTYSDTDWHHWTFVYDKSIASPTHNRFIYKDGELVASDRTNVDFSGTGLLRIGSHLIGSNQFFSGVIDDMKIWNIPRSLNQIRQDMFCTPTCYGSEMKLFLPFTDGVASGNNTTLNQIADYSLNVSNPQLVNFAKTGSMSNIVSGLNVFDAFIDSDNDGFGNTVISECYSGNWVSNNQDCNDGNSSTNPYAIELCSNSTDDDCDGNTDFEVNKAIHIGGSGKSISVPNLGHQAAFTVEAWVKPDDLDGNTIIEWLGGTHVTNLKIDISGRFRYNGGGTAWNVGPIFTVGQWAHIALVHDGYGANNLKAYVNGVLHWTSSINDQITNTSVKIGTNFDGAFDDFRYWNTALTQTQINERMNIRIEGNETNLIRYYTMDHGKPGLNNLGLTLVKDRTANNAHGTLAGFTMTGTTSNWVSGRPYIYYLDNDGDGYGGSSTWTCGSLETYKTNNLDCNDNNANIHPYANEICSNSTDDDCDGNTDIEVNKAIHIGGSGKSIALPNIAHQSAFTVEAWVKIDNIITNKVIEWLGGTTNAYFGIDNTGRLYYTGGGNAWNGGVTIATGQWAHVVLVHDGYGSNNVKTYLNGTLNWTATLSDLTSNTSTKIGINFDGAIDDFRYWNTALNQTQINERMNIRLQGNEANLIRYYTMDHGKPSMNNVGLNMINDRTSNSAHGTLEGFTLTGTTSNWVSGRTYPTLYFDADEDGFAGPTTWTCGSMNGLYSSNTDCNDNNAAINPNSTEICGNGVDENCNGIIDENTLSLGFDGTNDHVVINNTLGNFGTSNFTLEVRFKTTGTNRVIISKRPSCDCSNFWNIKTNGSGKVYFESCAGSVTSTNTANDGNWHHVSAVRSAGGTVSLYFDGVLEATNNINENYNNTAFVNFGDGPCNSDNLNGELDEVRIWNIARSALEINTFKNASLTGQESGLQAYYDFNHATAQAGGNNAGLTNLIDRTTNNNNGTLYNFALTGSNSNWLGNPTQAYQTVGAPSSNPTLCINTALTNIIHTTTGATGIGTASGLPSGVSAMWVSNTITISGTPSASGTFNYSIPLTGGCGSVNATGTIIVNPLNTAGTPSATPTLCINTTLTNITHTTTGATGIGTASGLPSGVSAMWASNTITISGTPSASGTFNYSVPLTGGCSSVSATGTITVTPLNTVGVPSSTPTLCINTALTNITHTTTGATGIGTASGLPSGVSAMWASNTITISGTP